jgi:hypothetical protein
MEENRMEEGDTTESLAEKYENSTEDKEMEKNVHSLIEPSAEMIANIDVLPALSYRAALLRQAAVPSVTVAPAIIHVQSQPWRPTFTVHKIAARVPVAPPSYVTVDDDEDDGLWGLIEAHARGKVGAALNRIRNATLLTPQQQEKKATRIAQKA